MEEIASTCIRLANDLQSYQKEVDEGKINALVILSRGYAVSFTFIGGTEEETEELIQGLSFTPAAKAAK